MYKKATIITITIALLLLLLLNTIINNNNNNIYNNVINEFQIEKSKGINVFLNKLKENNILKLKEILFLKSEKSLSKNYNLYIFNLSGDSEKKYNNMNIYPTFMEFFKILDNRNQEKEFEISYFILEDNFLLLRTIIKSKDKYYVLDSNLKEILLKELSINFSGKFLLEINGNEFPKENIEYFKTKDTCIAKIDLKNLDGFKIATIKNSENLKEYFKNSNIYNFDILILIIIIGVLIVITALIYNIGDDREKLKIKKIISKLLEEDSDFVIEKNYIKDRGVLGEIFKSLNKLKGKILSSKNKIDYYNKKLENSYKDLKNYTYIIELKNKELQDKLKSFQLIKNVLNQGIREISEINNFFKSFMKELCEYRNYKRGEIIYKNTIDFTYEKIIYVSGEDKFIENSYNENLKYLIPDRIIIKENYIEIPLIIKNKFVGSLKFEGIELDGNVEKTLSVLTNEVNLILENSNLYYKMERKIMDLSFLNSIVLAMSSVKNIGEMKDMMEDSIAILFGIKNYKILLYEKGYFLEFKQVNDDIVKIKNSLVEEKRAFIEKKYEIININGEYYIPLVAKENLIGVIKLLGNFNLKKLDDNIVKIFLTQISIILQNNFMMLEHKKQNFNIIKSLAQSIDEKDTYTRGHSERVMEYAVSISKKMDLSKEFIEKIRYAGILHDVGKIGIPENILQKKGKLTDYEYNIIKQHPEKGVKILSHISELDEIIDMVKYHHERPDGLGYPEGLKGIEIPFGARILAVADTFDAMTSDRPYRKGLSIDIAKKELEKYAGTQFDEEIAKVAIQMIETGELKIKG
ncbi:HD-GYP domain-containing protein [Haliovirga abyssi]|uniref:HD-GYP domain-containing protein n=1 Tax=Haliovirga abyssi TaxID=2996794 RepID=A0AAU9DCY1_9FUSO|nr:HD-GYP domain-containing protein [Haliovirga abyssi]BDU50162.1 hypothetical protein HLVA_07310 [Haliovirga abyssi]